MEVGPGVFVTAASANEWQPHAHPAGEIIVLCTGDGLRAGLWRSVPATTPQQMQWTAPSREVKIVLAGTSRIEIKDGPTLELKAGDVASLPRGASATWSFSPDYQEMWVLEEDRAGNRFSVQARVDRLPRGPSRGVADRFGSRQRYRGARRGACGRKA